MENCTPIQGAILWTRKFVVTLSIIIIFTSLSQYSKAAVPVTTLLPNNNGVIMDDSEEDLLNRIHSFAQALIEDRRLIATLVAAQTSIFCPLFLLMGNVTSCINHHHTNVDQEHSSSHMIGFWKTTLDLLCQIIMPLGLVLNWLFCLSFDHKTTNLIRVYFPTADTTGTNVPTSFPSSFWSSACNLRWGVSISFLEGLKFITIIILGLEMVLVCITWIQHCMANINHDNSKHSKSIQLV